MKKKLKENFVSSLKVMEENLKEMEEMVCSAVVRRIEILRWTLDVRIELRRVFGF